MLYKTLVITYALGLAGLGEAAPATARNIAARDGCATQSDCSDGTYCLRATPEDPYQCMTTDALEAAQPDIAKRQVLNGCMSSDPPSFCSDWELTSLSERSEELPENECSTDADCKTDGTHCRRATPDTAYMCMTDEEMQTLMEEAAEAHATEQPAKREPCIGLSCLSDEEAQRQAAFACAAGNCPDRYAEIAAGRGRKREVVGCSSSDDCGEGTHCVQLNGETEYSCRTTEEIITNAP